MKTGMTSLTLRNHTPREVVEIAAKAGLGGIEWGVSDTHIILGDFDRAREIADVCKSENIEVFALGSYCRMETDEDLKSAVETADALGAPIVRIWAGTKSPNECDEEYIDLIVRNTRYMADIAESYGICLGFEYHGGTLTQTADDAVVLIKRIDRPNVALYWQPDYELSSEENFESRNIVLPYCVGNMHIQNYTPENGYGTLSEIEDTLIKYYDDIKCKDYCLMIEFVKDGLCQNLMSDADTLKKVLQITQ